jgi:hypothetical protein
MELEFASESEFDAIADRRTTAPIALAVAAPDAWRSERGLPPWGEGFGLST